MKTKILFVSLLLSFSLVSFAQETAGYKTSFVRNGFWDNWFIHLGAGAGAYFGDNQDDADFMDRITVTPTVSVGKWFSPYWGVRVKGQGGAMHTFRNDAAFMGHDYYYNIHLDAMWNLANYWGVYSPTKTFNFTPYVGIGFARRLWLDEDANKLPVGYTRDHANALSVNGGIQFGFRLSNRINLDFDLGAAVLPDYFDRVTNDEPNDAILTASGGLTFKLGKTTFDVVEPMDKSLIDDLNGRINALRAENDMLSKRPASCPECPKVAPVTTTTEVNYVSNVVFFRINSSKVDDNQQISVYNTAQFMKDTGEKIKVIGYADKNTGSAEYNLSLSEKRAKAVAKELIEKYGIPSQNIVVEWKGAGEQPYSHNNWNRVVIMSAE